MLSVRIAEALRFAAEQHRHQRRKDAAQSPYINHLIEVLYLLRTVGGVEDDDLLVAAVLHDVVEDTDTTPEYLSTAFGEAVSAYVMAVTDDKTLPTEVRKRLQIEHAPGLSQGAKAIKLADKCANVADILFSPPHDWDLARRQTYLAWGKAVVDGLRGGNAALEARFDQLYAEGVRLLGMA